MRKIKFYLGTGFYGCDHEETFEFPDDLSDEEIEEEYKDWVDNRLDRSWYEIIDEDH